MNDSHTQAVAILAKQVKAFYAQGKAFKIYHGSTNSTRVLSFDKNAMVDVSHFNHVLSINKTKKVAVVEPNVPMDKLVDATLQYGLVPPVVMEFPGITVGGGLQGGAGESSSFKWGTFNRILNWYQIILADGRAIKTSPSQNADLFWGGAGAYGSLGVITSAEVKLVPAKTYVNLTYTPTHSFKEAIKITRQSTKQGHDFVDGILFSKDSGVIITGKMSNKPSGPIRRFSRAGDPWFYIHVQKLAKAGKAQKEAVPLKDYLFRYDRGAFWMGKHAFDRLKIPFNSKTRRLLNPLMNTRKLYQGLQASGISQECIIQDLALPAKNAVSFLEYIDQQLGFYPIWLCPLLIDRRSPLLSSSLDTKDVINVGVWGSLFHQPRQQIIKANRQLEATVRNKGGQKWLYAECFYTPKEFWSIYNKAWYDALRTKYRATSLPDVYHKTRAKDHPVNIKRGLLRTVLGFSGIRIS